MMFIDWKQRASQHLITGPLKKIQWSNSNQAKEMLYGNYSSFLFSFLGSCHKKEQSLRIWETISISIMFTCLGMFSRRFASANDLLIYQQSLNRLSTQFFYNMQCHTVNVIAKRQQISTRLFFSNFYRVMIDEMHQMNTNDLDGTNVNISHLYCWYIRGRHTFSCMHFFWNSCSAKLEYNTNYNGIITTIFAYWYKKPLKLWLQNIRSYRK